MSRFLFTQDTAETSFSQFEKQKQFDWRDYIVKNTPPIWSVLMVALAITAFFIEDYFLLEVISVSLCAVSAAHWLTKNRSRFLWISNLFNKTSERLCWIIYTFIASITLINPAFAGGGGGAGGCSASATILGPIADALIGVFNGTTEIGSTGAISDNICQVFTTFAAIIALLIIGSVLWGLFDNQGRGSDIGKAFAPLGVVLAGVVVVRIGIKLIMGV